MSSSISINPPEFEDVTKTCKDCGCEFVWEKGEQEFFFSKGLATPKRCPGCREKRRLTIVRVQPETHPDVTVRHGLGADYERVTGVEWEVA